MAIDDSTSYGGSEADLKKYTTPEQTVLRWLKEYNLVADSSDQKEFEKTGEKVIKFYRNRTDGYNAGTSTPRVMFNVLWSMVQILKPTYFCRLPKVVVERRFKDSDPVGRLASQIAEQATSFYLDSQRDKIIDAIKSAVEDRLLPGRGQCWVRFDAEFEEAVDPNGEPIVDASGIAIKQVKPNSEKPIIDYVNWLDYFHSPARNWYDEVRWQAKRVYMNRSQLIKRFGEQIGSKVELQISKQDKKKLSTAEQDFLMKAEVLEIEDKEGKKRLWISPGYKEGPLDEQPDNLHLNGFFSSPKPLLATTTTDSLYPTADFKIYEKLAEEYDYITKRLSAMADCVRLVGAMAKSYYQDVKNILKLKDGDVWPMEQWATWTEKGGFKGAIDWLSFEECANAIPVLTTYQQNLLQQIYDIVGLPDIVRGASDPNDPVYTQQQKSQWVIIKIQDKQEDVQRFCRDLISKVAEIIFEPGLFADETIALACGIAQKEPEDQQNFPMALALLRDDRLRTFRVDIETDSTIAIDEDANCQRWMTYLESIKNVVSEIEAVTTFRPELMHPIIESAKQAVRCMRTGRVVEGAWDKAWDQIETAMAQPPPPPPPPPPDPMFEIEMQKLQLAHQKEAFEEWYKSQELQQKGMAEQMKFEIDSQKVQVDGMKFQSQAQIDGTAQNLEKFKMNFAQYIETQKLELEKFKTSLDEKEKFLQEARLSAQDQLDAQKHAEKLAEIQTAGATNGASQPTGPIHIHTGGGVDVIKMARAPDGSLVGTKQNIPQIGQ